MKDTKKCNKGANMFRSYFIRQKKIHFILLIGALTLFLAACDSGGASPAGNAAVPTSSTVSSASAIIRHTPSGTVELTWDHTSHVLTVRIALTGLYPKSTHPALINSGSCKGAGKTVYTLSNVVADTIGFANTTTKIKDVANGIPASGWYVDVHNGPGIDTAAQGLAIACADVFNSTNSASSTATLNETSVPNQAADGLAQLAVTNNRLAVTVTMKGLAPNSKHSAHIHVGSCVSQGKIVYPLNPIVVNAAGDGSSTTTIDNVAAIPRSGWYINIHEGSHVDDASSQADMDPLACGDFTPRI